MIQETTTYTCRSCGSANIIKNGTNKCGNPQYHCKDCGAYRVLKPKEPHSDETQKQVLRAARERVSLRGIERIFKVCRQTVAKWIRDYLKQLPVIADTLLLYEVGDVLEIDELWSFVLGKEHKRWVWVALCRRTRQIVAFYIGKRDENAARQLEQRIPYPYTLSPMYTDQYAAYDGILPDHRLVIVGDMTYAAIHFLYGCQQKGVTVITRLRLDAALYDPPPPYDGWGRPRKKGAKQPTPQQVLEDEQGAFGNGGKVG